MISQSVSQKTSVDDFNIDLTINLNTMHNIHYKAGMVELLKNGWMTYFSLLIPSIVIGRWILQIICRYKLLKTTRVICMGHRSFIAN